MNLKQAKKLRKLLRQRNAYPKKGGECEYINQEHKLKRYVKNPLTGEFTLTEITKHTIINKSKLAYNKAKEAYLKGKLKF